MVVFTRKTKIRAPIEWVADFHYQPGALRRLTPPPVFAQIHTAQPLAEGSVTEFTLWFGPLPVRWRAVHSHVERLSGFTDTQAKGPLRAWVHRHAWSALGPSETLLEDRVEYEHQSGASGILTRILFAGPMLWVMFLYRHLVTRLWVERAYARANRPAPKEARR